MNQDDLKDLVNSHLSLITHKEFQGCARVINVDMKPLTDQPIVIVSDIFRAILTLELNNGTTKQIKTIAKLEPTTEGFSQLAKESGICEAETLIYSKVLNKMEELILSNEESSDQEIFWPKCYVCENNAFILEDLSESGFRIVPTQDMLDVNHVVLALEALGKYHGMSLVLKEQGKLDTSSVPANLLSKDITFINNIYIDSITKLAEVVEMDWEIEWREKSVPDKLRKLVENIGEKLKELVTSSHGKRNVLCHGDFTIRNMLFHYQDDNKTPDKIKFIDFQAASWSNFCFDLVPFLCSSMMPQIREDNLDLLLRTYSDSLNKTCNILGHTGYTPTPDDIRQTYDSFGLFSLLVTAFAVPALLAPINEFDPSKLLEVTNGSANDANADENNESFKASHFRHKPVQEALKFELERCLKLNILS